MFGMKLDWGFGRQKESAQVTRCLLHILDFRIDGVFESECLNCHEGFPRPKCKPRNCLVGDPLLKQPMLFIYTLCELKFVIKKDRPMQRQTRRMSLHRQCTYELNI